jgi:hypothetical protein
MPAMLCLLMFVFHGRAAGDVDNENVQRTLRPR